MTLDALVCRARAELIARAASTTGVSRLDDAASEVAAVFARSLGTTDLLSVAVERNESLLLRRVEIDELEVGRPVTPAALLERNLFLHVRQALTGALLPPVAHRQKMSNGAPVTLDDLIRLAANDLEEAMIDRPATQATIADFYDEIGEISWDRSCEIPTTSLLAIAAVNECLIFRHEPEDFEIFHDCGCSPGALIEWNIRGRLQEGLEWKLRLLGYPEG